MPIVRTDIPMTPTLCNATIEQLVRTYPFCRSEVLVNTVFQRPIRTLVIGQGPRRVLYTAAHHANEWITAPILLKFVEELAEADLERFRLLEELFLALSETDKQKRTCYPCRKRSVGASPRQDSLAFTALWERRRNIDCFETLMGRTEDRVVRSIFSKILSTERLLYRKLECVCNE